MIVKVTVGGNIETTAGPDAPGQLEPTRYARHLRRQAANRIRLERGEKVLPPIKPGRCSRCDGWGVVAGKRVRCSDCGGTGR